MADDETLTGPSSNIESEDSKPAEAFLDIEKGSPDCDGIVIEREKDVSRGSVEIQSADKSDDAGCPVIENEAMEPFMTQSENKQTKEHYAKKLKRATVKNTLVISISFMMLFTSYIGLESLQSTLNRDEGLGTGSLAIVYISVLVSCILVPPYMIARMGCKWTMVLTMGCYTLYMAANYYPVWGTMVPGAIILGLGGAPLWTAKCAYLTDLGAEYANVFGIDLDDIINRLFGVFFILMSSSKIWANLLSSTVLDWEEPESIYGKNLSDVVHCGAEFCPHHAENITQLTRPPLKKVYTLCGVYLCLGCLAVLTMGIFLDKRRTKSLRPSFRLLTHTLRLVWSSTYQKLLIPITLYGGFEQAFIQGVYTQAFIGCTLGIDKIGYVLLVLGGTQSVCSLLFGRMVQFVGHIPFFVILGVVHLSSQIILLVWTPNPDQLYLFYIVSVLWGVGGAVVKTQISALYGLLFREKTEAAFSNLRLWESLGFSISFAINSHVCTDVRLYLCMALLVFGCSMYVPVEIMYRKKKFTEKKP